MPSSVDGMQKFVTVTNPQTPRSTPPSTSAAVG
jgi:hypothetical protein